MSRTRDLIIRCQTHTLEDGILITVEDTGTGLDISAGQHVFDAMFTTKAGGMGMGLSISRSIITAHGGRIWASQGEPTGAIFRIFLPSKRRAEGDRTDEEDRSSL